MMLDRMGLSIKNRWFDSEGRAYIIFTIEDVMGMLGCQSQKAVRLVKELDTAEGIGLIEKKRVGLGRPNIIYVKNFMVREDDGTHGDTTAQGFSGKHGDTVQDEGKLAKETGTQEGICGSAGASVCGKPEKDTAQDEENWWMGGAATPKNADRAESTGNASAIAAGTYSGLVYGRDGQETASSAGISAFDNQNFGFMAGNVENVENVDKQDYDSADMSENQIPGEMFTYFSSDANMAGAECVSWSGQYAPDCAGWMPEIARMSENAGLQYAEGRTADSAGETEYADKSVGAAWRGVLGEGGTDAGKHSLMPEFCEGRGTTGQEYPGTQFWNSEKQSPGIVDGKALELRNAQRNDTDIKDTEYSETKNSGKENINTDFCASHPSNPSHLSNPSHPSRPAHPFHQQGMAGAAMQDGRQAEYGEPDGMAEKMDAYREVIRENISYACFQPHEMHEVDELVELMADAMTVPDERIIRIAGNEKPASVVKNCFMKLAHSHIQYVMECLQKHTGKIWNIKAYLLTALYNSVLTIGSYYRAEVNHDLYGC